MFKFLKYTSTSPLVYVASFVCVFFIFQYARILSSGFGFLEHGYWFADERFQLISNCIVCILPIVLVILIIFVIGRRWRLLFVLIALPVTLLFELLLCFCALLYGGMYLDHREEVPLKDGVVARIHCGVDAYCPKYDTSIWPAMLTLERRVAGGLLLEYKMLISIDRTNGAHIEVIDGGQKIRFSDGCDKEEIVRVLDSDWNSKSNGHCEHLIR